MKLCKKAAIGLKLLPGCPTHGLSWFENTYFPVSDMEEYENKANQKLMFEVL